MGYYARVKPEAPKKSKFRRLAKRLELNHPRAGFGLAASIWCLCWEHEFIDGRLKDFDSEDLARELEWKGDPEKLIEALLAERVIERAPDGTFIAHDWVEEQYGGIKIMERNRNRPKAPPAEAPSTALAKAGASGDNTVVSTLLQRMRQAHITGTAQQKREHAEAWHARKIADKAEALIMGEGKGQDIFTLAKMLNGGTKSDKSDPVAEIRARFLGEGK